MPLQYKIDILAALKEKGLTTYKLRQDHLLAEGAIQNLRSKAPISWVNIERVCELLECQPGDILEVVNISK